MRMIDIINKKKNGLELTDEEISFFVNGYTNGAIPDYQASALAMAICINSMTDNETISLTMHMAKSGDMLDLSELGNATTDKHSSGGVGDKTTLIVAPIVASAGCKVAKMSGRGLGFTGGTIDKLESIPNFSVSMTGEEFIEKAKAHSIVIAGQTGDLAPCDKKLYALRDVTATVDCIPLIASSIMSKKIAAGSKNIVLDVKCGKGAFMNNISSATKLAQAMVSIGKNCNRNISALITDMNQPLGNAIGNTLEVIEAVKVLKGENVTDLRELCLTLSAEMISLSQSISHEEALKVAENSLESGKAFEKFRELVVSQGGNVSFIDDLSKFPVAKHRYSIKASENGYISSLDALALGNTSVLLGAGRSVKEDKIDFSAGIILSAKIGDKVTIGDTIMTLYANDESKLASAISKAEASFEISKNQPTMNNSVILKHII